jgi:flavin reductase (NADH)/flavin reductase
MTDLSQTTVHATPAQDMGSPALSALPTVTPAEQRNGMRHLAAGVSIITAGDGQRRAGLTATAVCSVTTDPPRLVVFVNKNVLASELIRERAALAVNVLSGEQEDVARTFAGMVEGVHGEDRFNTGNWTTLVTGAPVLEHTLSSFDCRVIKMFDESTHHAFLCEVLSVRERPDGQALVYLNGAFRRIDQ